MPVRLRVVEGVHVLAMEDGENRMNRAWVEAMNDALDRVEEDTSAKALVTIGAGKFFSNGLDLDWLQSAAGEPMPAFVADVERLFGRLLGFPLLTVAACNGHVFAAGAMLALCHDYRVMRGDRGYFCLPEVDIKIPFTVGMDLLIRARMPPQVAHEAMVTGRRYGGFEAAERGIMDRAVAEDEVLGTAVELALASGGKDRVVLGAIKGRMYGNIIEELSNSAGTQPV